MDKDPIDALLERLRRLTRELRDAELERLGAEDPALAMALLSQLLDRECGDQDHREGSQPGVHASLRETLATLRGISLGAPPTLPETEGPLTPSRGSETGPPSGRDRVALPPRYEVEGEIGRGGMGLVLRARDRELSRSVAIKTLWRRRPADPMAPPKDPSPGSSPEIERFLEEAQVTAQLEHPGIVPVYEVGVDAEGEVFFTMRLVRGRTLREIFALARTESESWNLPRAVGVLVRVCQAVAYAHARGVLHRDLKPANIMVGRLGETYVMDWGLAKVRGRPDAAERRFPRPDESLGSVETRRARLASTPDSPLLTEDGAVIGTPVYMPPEQAAGDLERVDERSDVYALGAMLYELLAGHMPYLPPSARLNANAVLALVLNGPPAPLESIARDAPIELIAISRKAMAREPSERYSSALELAEDLQAFLDQRVVRAHRTGAIAELSAWTRRNRGVALATGAAVLLVILSLAVVAFVTISSGREIESRNLALGDANLRLQEANSRLVEEQERVFRLSALTDLDELAARADRLWPVTSALVEPIAAWLDDARAIASRLDLYRETLGEIRTRGTYVDPPGDTSARRGWIFASSRDAWWHDALETLVKRVEALDDPSPHAITLTALERRLDLARQIRDLTIEGDDARRAWDVARRAIRALPVYRGLDLAPTEGLFPLGADPQSGLWEFWHVASGERPERGADGRFRIESNTGVVLVLVPGGETRVGAEPASPGLAVHGPEDLTVMKLRPDGLAADLGVKIGDRIVALDGTSITRAEDLARLCAAKASTETIEVVVLRDEERVSLRGVVGPNVDPDAALSEGPVRTIDLDPFFISKYEFTQGQWLRAIGVNPSYYRAAGEDAPLSAPVEQVTWLECDRVLGQLGLEIPTEAQWEHAARGGTTTPWWTGPRRESLRTAPRVAASIADRKAASVGAPWPEIEDWPDYDDGYVAHGPAGTFLENPYGLDGVVGNVWEWCRDRFVESWSGELREGDGLHLDTDLEDRTVRGGGFSNAVGLCRSAVRQGFSPGIGGGDMGVRPSMSLPASTTR